MIRFYQAMTAYERLLQTPAAQIMNARALELHKACIQEVRQLWNCKAIPNVLALNDCGVIAPAPGCTSHVLNEPSRNHVPSTQQGEGRNPIVQRQLI